MTKWFFVREQPSAIDGFPPVKVELIRLPGGDVELTRLAKYFRSLHVVLEMELAIEQMSDGGGSDLIYHSKETVAVRVLVRWSQRLRDELKKEDA